MQPDGQLPRSHSPYRRAAPIRDVLRVAAQACAQFAEVEYESDQARDEADELRELLKRVEKVLTSEPLPTDGGSWAVFELAQQVQQALGQPEQG